jgi:hypothetical protein
MIKKRLKSVLVLGIAALSLTTVGVATAAAATPEILNKEGKQLIKNTFTGKTEDGKVVFKGAYGLGFECTSATVTGEVTGINSGTGTMTLTGCNVGPINCKTAKQKEGVMILPFTEKLVFTSKTETALFMLRTINAPIKCRGEEEVRIFGGYLTPIRTEQTNKLKTAFLFNPRQDAGKQDSLEYYNTEKGELVKEILEWEGGEVGTGPLGVEMTESETFAEEVEFKS